MATVSNDVAIPEVFAAQVLASLKKSLVYGAPGVVNRNYEGEIAAFGDTVHIVSVGAPAIDDYTVNGTLSWDNVTDSKQTLEISQAKSFAFKLDDIIKRQARSGQGIVDDAALQAAYGLRDAFDQYLASVMAAGASTDLGGVTLTSAAAAYELLVDLGVALDEANVPEMGRFIVVPPSFHGLIRKDQRFVAAGDASGAVSRLNGQIGEAAGFSILKSNNAPNANGVRTLIAGVDMATTVAENINNVETVRLQDTFATGLRGLHLYGAKVVRGSALAVADVTINL